MTPLLNLNETSKCIGLHGCGRKTLFSARDEQAIQYGINNTMLYLYINEIIILSLVVDGTLVSARDEQAIQYGINNTIYVHDHYSILVEC